MLTSLCTAAVFHLRTMHFLPGSTSCSLASFFTLAVKALRCSMVTTRFLKCDVSWLDGIGPAARMNATISASVTSPAGASGFACKKVKERSQGFQIVLSLGPGQVL